ncbi:MAG TPA: PEP-CTERM sorting domain-containing protein [Phycisphaerae bacterium]|nr:PEP-CTERM sorting domain-containing protein [Phycisphaerae bacterium]HRW53297.1 PEP-CTERM sorting domain-containing protein [Phycisphaerae bacterium]
MPFSSRYLVLAVIVLVSGGEVALAAPTVGVYDENTAQANTIDFEASGSNISLSQFTSEIADAFADDRGGVNDGFVFSSLPLEYGVSQSKTLLFEAIDGTNVASGVATASPTAISGTSVFASTPEGGYNYTAFGFTNILNGVPDERVVAFGVTTLSVNNRDYGNVSVTGALASGGSLAATRHMFEPATMGDTFFGLRAPANDYFTGFSLTYDGGAGGDNRLWFDDIGFITAPVTVPEPASVVMCLVGAIVITGRRRRPQDGLTENRNPRTR